MSAIIDLTGQRFGCLTAIRHMPAEGKVRQRWVCQCDCGKETEVASHTLRAGQTRSCGCGILFRAEQHRRDLIDLTGQRFGRLVVVFRIAGSRRTKPKWLCRCDCGNEKAIGADHLRSGATNSCGCLHKMPEGEAANRALIRMYKNGARDRKLEWDLNPEEFRELTQLPCAYCGIEPSQTYIVPKMNGAVIYNGIDRIDSSKGYIRGNVTPCCGQCNFAKRSMSVSEFTAWISRIHAHLKALGRIE